jgi:hypothetical protein
MLGKRLATQSPHDTWIVNAGIQFGVILQRAGSKIARTNGREDIVDEHQLGVNVYVAVLTVGLTGCETRTGELPMRK